jgi:hypothetical protein
MKTYRSMCMGSLLAVATTVAASDARAADESSTTTTANVNVVSQYRFRGTFGYPMALGLIATACELPYWRFRRAGWL